MGEQTDGNTNQELLKICTNPDCRGDNRVIARYCIYCRHDITSVPTVPQERQIQCPECHSWTPIRRYCDQCGREMVEITQMFKEKESDPIARHFMQEAAIEAYLGVRQACQGRDESPPNPQAWFSIMYPEFSFAEVEELCTHLSEVTSQIEDMKKKLRYPPPAH